MALHLILLAVNKVNPGLQGSIILHSDCAGALARMSELPDGRLPSVCKHTDILKTILIASKQISLRRLFQHRGCASGRLHGFLLPVACFATELCG